MRATVRDYINPVRSSPQSMNLRSVDRWLRRADPLAGGGAFPGLASSNVEVEARAISTIHRIRSRTLGAVPERQRSIGPRFFGPT
jgi:hypothetical protein